MITREEFGRLLDEYASDYAQAVLASFGEREDREEWVKKSLVSRKALETAVLGETP